jgi:hypothetical protein
MTVVGGARAYHHPGYTPSATMCEAEAATPIVKALLVERKACWWFDATTPG